MDKKKYFNTISQIHLEGCLDLPVEELESFDNSVNLKHLKFQYFQAKKSMFKERNSIILEEGIQKVKDKVNQLLELPIETLQKMLLQRSPNMQFRYFDKLDKNELIKILEDYMLLDDLENENE